MPSAQAPIPLGGPMPAPVVRSSSGAKILLIVVGIFVLMGALGVGGIAYVAYRAKQRITQLKNDYGVGVASTGATISRVRAFPPSQGSGCAMLQGQEAAQILGVAVERAESEIAPGGNVVCQYWVSASERRRLMREEFASGIARIGNSDAKSGQSAIENIIGGAAGALNESDGDNKNSDYAFSLQVWRTDGKAQWDKVETVQTRTSNVVGSNVAMSPVQGVGDRATEIAAGHSIMVLKGDKFFLLGFQQFVPGREKTEALARVVAGRL